MFRPARPGDSVTIYGIGFGDVTPAIAPGVTVAQLNRLTRSFTLQFGTVLAVVTYQGLAPGTVGLYQFNFTVPQVAEGDYQIKVSLGGQAVAQTVFLTIGR